MFVYPIARWPDPPNISCARVAANRRDGPLMIIVPWIDGKATTGRSGRTVAIAEWSQRRCETVR
jgi:hypothetical protein